MVTNQILITASASVVWDVLVNPEHTAKYMFGCKTISNWNIGDDLVWEMQHEGKPFVPVTGKILDFKENRLLKYSVIDPHATYPATAENHLHVTYILDENLGTTVLTVTQDNFEDAADGEKRFTEVYNNGDGWNPILVQIKEIAETL